MEQNGWWESHLLRSFWRAKYVMRLSERLLIKIG
jgi:hypothetical protein